MRLKLMCCAVLTLAAASGCGGSPHRPRDAERDRDSSTEEVDAATPDEPDGGSSGMDAGPAVVPEACAFAAAATSGIATDNPNCPDGVYRGDAIYDLKTVKGCVRIARSLEWRSSVDLDQLDELIVIDGSLEVLYRCPNGNCDSQPRSVNGLGKLRCVGGDLRIGGTKKAVADIDGLQQLVEVGGTLELHVSSLQAPDSFRSLKRVWGDLISDPVLPFPVLDTIYGKLTPSPYGSDSLPAPTPKLAYVGCDGGQQPCRDGFLGCAVQAQSQADVDLLKKCKKSLQGLELTSPEITDLTPLRQLTDIGGDLVIGPETESAAKLKSLAGLDALRSARSLTIRNLPQLDEVHALHELRDLPSGNLTLDHLGKLQDLKGLGAVRWQSLTLSNDGALRSLDGLSASAVATNASIIENPELLELQALAAVPNLSVATLRALPKLVDLRGLSHLQEGRLQVERCDGLQDLTGLAGSDIRFLSLVDNAGLRSTAGWSGTQGPLWIGVSGSPLLTSLEGLFDEGRTEAGELTLERLPALTDLRGLHGLQTASAISLTHCDGLTDLSGLDRLKSIETLTLKDNAQLRDLTGSSAKNVWLLLVDGNPKLEKLTGISFASSTKLSIRNTSKLRDLSGLEEVQAAPMLELVNNAGLESLHGLGGLRSAGDQLDQARVVIENNPLLKSLDGLDALEEVTTGLQVTGNAGLERLGMFPKLRTLGWLGIGDNPNLTSLVGLPALELLGELDIGSNAKLADLAGLERATQVGGLRITDSPALVDLRGLQVQIVNSVVHISGNPKLTSLHGLETLERVDAYFDIIDNPELQDLDGLSGLRTLGLWFELKDNTALPQCEIESLLTRFPDVTHMVENNGPPGMCTP